MEMKMKMKLIIPSTFLFVLLVLEVAGAVVYDVTKFRAEFADDADMSQVKTKTSILCQNG